MKKIDTSNSLIFGSKLDDLKNSLEHLDQEGYFSNSKDFSEYTEGYLDVVEVADFVFSPYAYIYDGDRHVFEYFIPKSEAVFVEEEPEKKGLRPFESREEFFKVTGFKVGDIVQIKRFGNIVYEETATLTRIRLYLDGAYSRLEIYFGSNACSLDELFEYYEYYKNGEWKRFGVEE